MTVYCPSCGKPNTDEAANCAGCGNELKKPTAGPRKFKGTMMMGGLAGAPTPGAPAAGGPPAGGPPLAGGPTPAGGLTPPGQPGVGAPAPAVGSPAQAGSPDAKRDMAFQKTMIGGPMAPPPGAAPAPAPAPAANTGGGFGAPPESTGGGFGAPPASSGGGFGAPPPASTGGAGFGAPPASGGGFGAPASTAGGAGAPPPSGGFGAPPAGGGGGFGAPPAGGDGFGAPPAGGGGFGAPPAGGGGFGTPPAGGGFGAPPAGGGGFGTPPAGGGFGAAPPGGAAPGGGDNKKKILLGVGIGCLLLLCVCSGVVGWFGYQQYKVIESGIREGTGEFAGLAAEMQRPGLLFTLNGILMSCANDPTGAGAANYLVPAATAELQGEVCKISQNAIDAFGDPARSSAGRLAGSAHEGVASQYGLDASTCYIFTSGGATLIACTGADNQLRLLQATSPNSVQ